MIHLGPVARWRPRLAVLLCALGGHAPPPPATAQPAPSAAAPAVVVLPIELPLVLLQPTIRDGFTMEKKNIARCSYFIPVISAATERWLEAFFGREWSYALDRTRNMADEAIFVLPVCIDATDPRGARVPDKFKALHIMQLPGGEPPPEFVQRIAGLLSGQGRGSGSGA